MMKNTRPSKDHSLLKRVYFLCPLFIILFLFNWVLNQFGQFDVFTLCILIVFLLIIYWNDPVFIIKYSFLLFLFLTNLIGVFVIEHSSIWLGELQKQSSSCGSFFLLALAHWFFILLVWMFELKYGQRINNKIATQNRDILSLYNLKNSETLLNFLICFLTAGFLLFLIRVVRNPAFLLGLDRVEYERTYLTGIYRPMQGLFAFFAPLIGMLYIVKQKRKFFLVVALYFLCLFMSGVKFGAFIIALYQWIPIVLYQFSLTKKQYKKIAKYVVVVLAMFIGVVMVHNKTTYQYSIQENAKYIGSRLAQQGQMWWTTYNDQIGKSCHINEFRDELSVWFKWNATGLNDYNYGIYKLMKQAITYDMFQYRTSVGWRYAAGTDAYVLYYFGSIGLILYDFLFAALYCLIVNWYMGSFRSLSIVDCLLAGKFVSLMHLVLSQCDFDRLFSIKVVLYLVVLLIYHFFGYYRHIPKMRSFTLNEKQD